MTVAHLSVEMGRSLAMLDVEVSGQWFPGERRTLDYPGCPGYWDDVRVRATRLTGYASDGEIAYRWSRAERPDWFALLDRIAANAIDGPEALDSSSFVLDQSRFE